MPTVPLYGHDVLRDRLRQALATSSLPSTLLLHGPPSVGKQRIALWLGQLLLCNGPEGKRPCGGCEHCKYTVAFNHPDLRWYFPRPRPKDSDPSAEEVALDYAAAIAQRVEDNLLYPPASGADGIFVATVRAMVKAAGLAPALARRKVFIVGNAERMVSQEGSDQAANAFLKLLEEPPANTTLILTTSEPGALLPTVRSRVVSFRINKLAEPQMRAFLHDPILLQRKGDAVRALESDATAMRAFLRAGAPGVLTAADSIRVSFDAARAFLAAVSSGRKSEMIKASFSLGSAGARGAFTDFLGALTELAHAETQAAVAANDNVAAPLSADAVLEVDRARQLASGNITPQLVGIRLARAFAQVSK